MINRIRWGLKRRADRENLYLRLQAVIGNDPGMLQAIIELAQWGFPFEKVLPVFKMAKTCASEYGTASELSLRLERGKANKE